MTNPAERLGRWAPDSPEWHEARSNGLGGSEIAAVLGLSPFQSRFGLWHRKQGLAGPERVNPAMRWGTLLEDVIAQAFAANHPEYRVRRTGTWRNRKRPYQIANPDRLIYAAGRRMILEIKNAPGSDEWGANGSDEIPIYYRCQVQWYMDTLGVDTAMVAVLIRGSDYREYTVPYDHGDAMIMRRAAVEFMTSIADGVRPDIDAHSQTYQIVRDQHADIADRAEPIPRVLAEEYLAAVAAYDDAKADKEMRSAQLLDAMGDAREAITAGIGRVAIRKPGSRGGVSLVPNRPKQHHNTIKEALA